MLRQNHFLKITPESWLLLGPSPLKESWELGAGGRWGLRRQLLAKASGILVDAIQTLIPLLPSSAISGESLFYSEPQFSSSVKWEVGK